MRHRHREPAPGVLRLVLPLPFPGLDRVNCYALTSEEGVTLVDGGIYDPDPTFDHGWTELEDACEAAGFGVAEVVRLVITHPHVDHYGMAARLVEATGCELWMHEAARAELLLYSDPKSMMLRLRSMLEDHGVGEGEIDELLGFEDWRAFAAAVVAPTRDLVGGETFEVEGRSWEVVHTPGHSAAHICLWSAPDRLLISGDHLLGTVTPHIDFRRGFEEDPLGAFLASLEILERLDPVLVLPGHGRPFTDGAARARVVARHHQRRLGAIVQIVRDRPKTADQITDEVFGTTLLNFHRRLALGEALAHLAYLRKRGEVERTRGKDGVFRYLKASWNTTSEDER
jgi:glyoxylase-like metal-dependent hydrolase (beta-lactamase superfamily II)